LNYFRVPPRCVVIAKEVDVAHAFPSISTDGFHLYTLGAFRLERQSQSIRLPTRKVELLLAYLVLHPEQHSREKIAALLWGDSPDQEARRSLRVALTALRKQLGEECVLTDRETVQINPSYPLRTDVIEFREQATRFLAQNPPDPAAVNINIYQGDLLSEFYEDWILPERSALSTLYLDMLLRLTQYLRSQSEYERVIELSKRVLQHDPANEPAYQHLMFCYMALGDRHAALKQYEECQRSLQEELGVEPSPETIALYEHIQQASPRKSGIAANSNLPIPLTSFIGRQQETAKVKVLITGEGEPTGATRARLVTLIGAGGCGKTRLAIQAAAGLAVAFADGIYWVDLAVVKDAALVPITVSKALGLRDEGRQPVTETLVGYLRAKQLLLVIDNCEHLVSACADLIAGLLSQCSSLQVLATSREALGITGEVHWRVPSLTLPTQQTTLAPPSLLEWEAIQLFVDRAAQMQNGFTLTPSNAPAILQICRQLDGIPLAIELAAVRVTALLPEQIADRLNDRFNLLTSGSRTALPRQQTLRATLDWSYDLLSTAERTALQRLAVFAGSWSLEAAEATCEGEPIECAQIVDLLTHLVDKSLVLVDHHDQEIRYRMLDSIRQYAQEKLLESERSDRVYQHHLAFFLRLAEQADPELRGPQQAIWMSRLELESDNLRAALAWSLQDRAPKADDALQEAGLRLAGALGEFWFRHDDIGEGGEWLNKALIESAQTSASTRAKTLCQAGRFAALRGDLERATALLEQSLCSYREFNDSRGVADLLYELGVTACYQGNREQAATLLEESLALFRSTGYQWGIAAALMRLGEVRMRRGHTLLAASLWEESLALFRKLGDEWGQAFSLGGLGDAARLQGDYGRALTLFQQSLMFSFKGGAKLDVAFKLEALAALQVAQGQPERAIRWWGAAQALREAIHAPLPPSYQSDYDSSLNAARAQLGETAFETLRAEGRAMTLGQALEEVLSM
jgi:predicted ATPase/DNA-binding SARP family transcriptional activator